MSKKRSSDNSINKNLLDSSILNDDKVSQALQSLQQDHLSATEYLNKSILSSSIPNDDKVSQALQSLQQDHLSATKYLNKSILGSSIPNDDKVSQALQSLQQDHLSATKYLNKSILGSSIPNDDKVSQALQSLQQDHLSFLDQYNKGVSNFLNQNINNIFKTTRELRKQYPSFLDQYQNFAKYNSTNEKSNLFGTIKEANLSLSNHLKNLPKNYQYERKNNNENQISPTYNIFIKTPKNSVPVEELERGFGLIDLVKEISEEEMVSFVGHLMQYPMLALEHKVGKLIRATIKKLAKVKHVNSEFYRCRVRPAGVMMPWTAMEMWEAPLGVSSQGRFNIEGNGFLYVSSNEKVSLLEMKQPLGTLIDVMKINFDADINIIDITDPKLELFRYCMFRVSENAKIKKEYLIPNFLSQCCQIEKVHAIKYNSVLDSGISNYVFFDYLKEWFTYESSASKTITND